jgi:(p)ppGpp synthase/HD superfamily hydrolase
MARSSYAQTNLQLYAELRQAGYSLGDTGDVHAAYELALPLFTGCYRGSGKPFLAHAVGTASILASLHARGPVVATGLLHAAYTHGEFGNGWRGAAPEKRKRLRDTVGPEIEDLVARYTALRWNARTLPEIHDRLDALCPLEQEVLLVRLANELEDHLELGVLYCADAGRRRDYIRSSLHLCVDMAQRLAFPQLAHALADAFRETLAAEVPTAFCRRESVSFVVAPASHRLRLTVRLRYLFARLQGR